MEIHPEEENNITLSKYTLADCEAIIEKGLQTFLEVGTALQTIRDGKLYKDGYTSFDGYCQQRWGMKANYAYKQIAAARVLENLETCTIVHTLPATETQARHLAKLQLADQIEVWECVVEEAEKDGREVSENDVKLAVQKCVKTRLDEYGQLLELRPVHIGHNSGVVEWYTPPEIIEAARTVLGSIDTDPASNNIANKVVKAGKYFDATENGLEHNWFGNVWMNPPYSLGLIDKFIAKLITEIDTGRVTSAITLTNNATETQWFSIAAKHACGMCTVERRIKYLNESLVPASTPLQGQILLYFGNDLEAFRNLFSIFGFVWCKL